MCILAGRVSNNKSNVSTTQNNPRKPLSFRGLRERRMGDLNPHWVPYLGPKLPGFLGDSLCFICVRLTDPSRSADKVSRVLTRNSSTGASNLPPHPCCVILNIPGENAKLRRHPLRSVMNPGQAHVVTPSDQFPRTPFTGLPFGLRCRLRVSMEGVAQFVHDGRAALYWRERAI